MIRKAILWATKGKPLSKKVTAAWVTHVLTLAVAWVISRYGLDLSIGDSSLVSGICSVVAAPIAGFLVRESKPITIKSPDIPVTDSHYPVPSPFAVQPPVSIPNKLPAGRHSQDRPSSSSGSPSPAPVQPTPPLPKGGPL